MQLPCEVNMLKAAPHEGYFGAICRSRLTGEPIAGTDAVAWAHGPGSLVVYSPEAPYRGFLITPEQVPEAVKSCSVHRVGAEWFGGKSPDECGFKPLPPNWFGAHAEDPVVLEMVAAGKWHALKE